MKKINLEQIRDGFRKKPFRELVALHITSMDNNQRSSALISTMKLLPVEDKPALEAFIDRWNARAHKKCFWGMDTATLFDEIVEDARNCLSGSAAPATDDTLFNMFNIIVINFAHSASEQPKMQEFMGIKKQGFPWASSLFLLYPIAAAFYLHLNTPASISTVFGYGITNLGYLLIAAGIVSGSFKALWLEGRLKIFLTAAVAIIIGIFLSNILPIL